MEELTAQFDNVPEGEVKFKAITDRQAFIIHNPDIEANLVEISGYDLSIRFNMEYLKSLEDVEAALDGLTEMFRKIIMDELLKNTQIDANTPNNQNNK
jgi:hypothetical protein